MGPEPHRNRDAALLGNSRLISPVIRRLVPAPKQAKQVPLADTMRGHPYQHYLPTALIHTIAGAFEV